MANQMQMYHRIWWKDFRHLLPTMIALLTITSIMFLGYLIFASHYDSEVFLTLLLVPPMLFSSAAGAVLISQEFDRRTLTWLSGLPISARQLLAHKSLVGLSGLMLLWCISGALFGFWNWMGPFLFVQQEVGLQALMFAYFFHSFYILICAYTAAWSFRSMLASMLAILPLSIIPLLLALVFDEITSEIYGRQLSSSTGSNSRVYFSCLAVSFLLVAAVGYRIAIRRLRPVASIRLDTRLSFVQGRLAGAFGIWPEILRGNSESRTKPLGRLSSLHWQFRHQHIGFFFSVVVVVIISYWLAFQAASQNAFRSRDIFLAEPIVLILALLSVSLLGLMVFQGDNLQHRICFLAERGVAPGPIWWSRQAPALLITLVIFFAFHLLAMQQELHRDFSPFLWALLIFYSISQWVGQACNSLAVSIVLGSCLSIGTALLAINFYEVSDCPFWIIALLFIGGPLLATRWQTRRWMDGQRDWPFLSRHLGFSALITLVAFAAHRHFDTSYHTAYPVLFNAARGAFLEEPEPFDYLDEWQQASPSDPENLLSAVSSSSLIVDKVFGQKWRNERYKAIDAHLAKTTTPLNGRGGHLFIPILIGERLKFNQLKSENASESQLTDANHEYQSWMSLLTRYVPRIRRSPSLSDQDLADVAEIWLLSEVLNPEMNARLDQATLLAIADLVGKADDRWFWRREAVLHSWRTWYSRGETSGYTLRGMEPNDNERIQQARYHELLEQVSVSLIQYIDDAKRGTGTFPAATLVSAFKRSPVEYGLGPSGERFRIDQVQQFVWGTQFEFAPAQQWGAGWEEQGRLWSQSLLNGQREKERE